MVMVLHNVENDKLGFVGDLGGFEGYFMMSLRVDSQAGCQIMFFVMILVHLNRVFLLCQFWE